MLRLTNSCVPLLRNPPAAICTEERIRVTYEVFVDSFKTVFRED